MFGYYVMHNIGIAFQTFASGLLMGVGSGFFLATGGETKRVPELTATMQAEVAPNHAPADLPTEVWASTAKMVAK